MRRIIAPNSTELLSVIIEELNGPKYVHCRLLCFEVKLKDGDQALDPEEFVPVVLKYEKTLKSINDYLNQTVKTGSISLLLVDKDDSDRNLYSQVTELFKDVLALEDRELLSRDYSDNLLPKSAASESKSPQFDTAKASTTAYSVSSKDPSIKKDSERQQTSTISGGRDAKDGKSKNQKKPQNLPVQPVSKPTPAPAVMEDKPSPTMTADTEKEEEYTFHDVLNEVRLGVINATSALNSPLLADKPDLKEELANLVSRPQQLTVRYSNSHKLRCHNCGKPGYHICKVGSSSASRLSVLFKTLRDGKVTEYPSAAVTLSVLVSDESALALFEPRAFSDDGGRGIQLKSNIDINYCLETMQKKEDMGKDSLVDCSKCGKKTEREVCYIIEKAPKLFLIQLKRFKTDIDYKTGTIEKRKVSTMIELKESIAIKDQEFELYGVVNHYGEIDKGHYTACVKRPTDGQWFLYDDEKVSRVTFKDVSAEAAYLLFFRLRQAESLIN